MSFSREADAIGNSRRPQTPALVLRAPDRAKGRRPLDTLRAAPYARATVNRPHQRKGSISNAHVGAAFEKMALEYFATEGISLERDYKIPIGLNEKKQHGFDLGSSNPKIIIECKSHKWTEGLKVPNAKMTLWNEAMFYFHLAPSGFRKIMFVLHDKRGGDGETLLGYYRRTYHHLIPNDVEFWELDEKTGNIQKS